MKRITYVSLLLCLALIGFQCSPEKKNYKKVRSVNTVEAYEEFLIQYPESEYGSLIEIWIDSLRFSSVKNSNTVKDYTYFIDNYPQSNYIDSAKYYLDKIHYDVCLAKDSIQTYIEYLEAYPKSVFATMVVQRLKTKGTILKLSLKKLVSLDKISNNTSDQGYFEYKGILEFDKEKNQVKSSIKLWFQKDGYDKYLNEVDQFYGWPGQQLGGRWEYSYYQKGQIMSTTIYDVYGRPTTTKSEPAVKVFINIQFVFLFSFDEYALVLLLPESNIVSDKI